jgi:hypothetical protein
MESHQIKKLLHSKRNNQQSKETAYRIGRSICQQLIQQQILARICRGGDAYVLLIGM